MQVGSYYYEIKNVFNYYTDVKKKRFIENVT